MGAISDTVYVVKTKTGLKSILYSQIEYIENSSRKLKIHLTNGEKITSIYIRESFEKEIEELINSKKFVYVHKSFLINMNYIRTVLQNTVVMDSGINIHISKKNIRMLKGNIFCSSQIIYIRSHNELFNSLL